MVGVVIERGLEPACRLVIRELIDELNWKNDPSICVRRSVPSGSWRGCRCRAGRPR